MEMQLLYIFQEEYNLKERKGKGREGKEREGKEREKGRERKEGKGGFNL